MEGPQIREISPLRALFSARLAYPMEERGALGYLFEPEKSSYPHLCEVEE